MMVFRRVVLADVLGPQKPEQWHLKTERRYQKPERGHKKRDDGTKNLNDGTFALTALLQTAVLFPLEIRPKSPCSEPDLRLRETRMAHFGLSSSTFQGFSNVPWRKRAFGPDTKYAFLEIFLGILGALHMGKGAPLVRYLCTT